MTPLLGASAFANLGAVPISQPLGASAFSNLGAVPVSSVSRSVTTSPSVPYVSSSQQPSILNQVVNSPGIQSVLGAGDAIRNAIASGLNILPKVNISPVKTGEGTAYDIGNIAGNIGTFAGGGEALESARALTEAAPYIGQAASMLGGQGLSGIARRALGSAIYGGLTSNVNRTQQAGLGAGLSVASEAIPGIAGKLAQASQYFMPQRFAQKIISDLGDGQTLENATKSVLANVKNSYEAQKESASDIYNSVLDSVSDSNIYAKIKGQQNQYFAPSANVYMNAEQKNIIPYLQNPELFVSANQPLGETGIFPTGKVSISPEVTSANVEPISGGKSTPQQSFSKISGQYPNLPNTITDSYTNELKDMHNNFINNPTFSNAHALQSELGTVSRQLTSGNTPPTIDTINNATALNNARNALKNDMNNFLTSQNPELAKKYQIASDMYLQNVVPYKTNSKIYSIATGDTTNVKPSTLANIFAAPDADMDKVISDLPSGTIDKILYTKLGQTVPNKSAQGLLNSFQNLQQQGLGSYISPKLSNQLGELENRIKARNGLQMAAGALAGAATGSHAGSLAGATLGFGGAAIASPFINYIGKRLPIDEISQAISNVMRGTYPIGRSAILANVLNRSGVQQNAT